MSALAGLRIVITRAEEQAGELAARLTALGAEVIELATIAIAPASDYGPLDAAAASLASYDWLIFTSANGVRAFARRADLSALRARVCAIGPATRRALEELGLKVDLVPERYVAESLVAAFASEPLAGRRILLPRAAVARDVVPRELKRLGAEVDVVEAYRTVIPEDAQARAQAIFAAGRKPDWIAFTSSSTANNFLAVAGKGALEGVRVASIGPVTSATLRGQGVAITAEAARYTIDGLIDAILQAR